jgi:hypothetical protein
MKKLYLSITLLGIIILMFMITLIPVQAYTFNGSYDFSDIDLDDSLSELNGASLNDLFDYEYIYTLPLASYNGVRNKFELDGNEIVFNQYLYYDKVSFDITQFNSVVNGDFTDGTNGWIAIANGASVTNNELLFEMTGAETQVRPTQDVIAPTGNKLFVAWQYKINSITQGNFKFQIADLNDSVSLINKVYNTTQTTYLYDSAIVTSTNGGIQINIYAENTPILVGAFDNIIAINMTALGIEHYTEQNMKELIQNGTTDVIETFSTPIQNTEITQSLIVNNLENMNIDLINYYFAVFLLHKFNLPVDDLWDQAFNAGELSGYNQGFNEGSDYMATNNISLLSIFEVLIGIMMSFVGFIINIELFGISIASVLAMLGIGIVIIWTLKLIRG